MAGDWIKMELATPDKPEVLAMAAALNVPREHVIGCLFMVWKWFDQQTVDGHARVTLASLSRHAGLDGFAEQMVEVGWLSTGRDGAITVPNFTNHNGKTAKNRALSAKRSQKYRHASVTPPVTPASRIPRDQEKRRSLTPNPFAQSAPSTAIQRRNCAYCPAEAVGNVNGLDHCRQHADFAFDRIKPDQAKALISAAQNQTPQAAPHPPPAEPALSEAAAGKFRD